MKTGESAKTFLLSIQNEKTRDDLERLIMMLVSDVEVFNDKMPGATPPRVVVTDSTDIAPILSNPHYGSSAVISLGKLLNADQYLDDVVSNKLQTVESIVDEDRLLQVFNKALKYSFEFGKAEFRQRALATGDTLFKMGEQAGHVYIVKKGKLRAFQPLDSGEKELGTINAGDFVGEMAYFNNEPRSASVVATETCDLIEIPIHNFEAVLMQKPLWCKKLLQIMSLRLRAKNG
jgi:hypothetical protein